MTQIIAIACQLPLLVAVMLGGCATIGKSDMGRPKIDIWKFNWLV